MDPPAHAPLPADLGPSWGNWSADCVSAISGKTASMRQVRFETIESRDLSARTSVLARVPVNS